MGITKLEFNEMLKEYVFSDNEDGVEYVLEQGADPNIMITMRKKSKLSTTTWRKLPKWKRKRVERGTNYVIHKAVLLNNYKMVKYLLKYGASASMDYNSKKCGTALNCAIKRGDKSEDNYKIVDILLNYGANPYIKDDGGFHSYKNAMSQKGYREIRKGDKRLDEGRYLDILKEFINNNKKEMSNKLNFANDIFRYTDSPSRKEYIQ